MPPGQFLYVGSKLLGLYGLVFLWVHMSYAILRYSAIRAYLLPWGISEHRITAVFSLTLIVLHLGFFVMAVAMRKGLITFDVLFPDFLHGSYNRFISLGAMAFWLLLLVAIVGYLFSLVAKNVSWLTWLHRLSYLSFILVYFHGLGVGSETKNGFMFGFYLFMGISFLGVILVRIWGVFSPRFYLTN
jgi:predicted ferric reductase